jgi:enoyl-[acyl-carrier protein] reductase I
MMTGLTNANGMKGLIVGIVNEHSTAYGCARDFRAAGADLAVTYLNARAEAYVRPLGRTLGSEIVMPCDVTVPGQLESVFEAITKQWGRLDFVLHYIAYARAEVFASSRHRLLRGWIFICDAGLHAFVSPHGQARGTLDDVRWLPVGDGYYGADKVVAHYNVMGPVKAVLEAAVRLFRRSRVRRTFCSCRILRQETCSRSNWSISPTRQERASYSALACPSS